MKKKIIIFLGLIISIVIIFLGIYFNKNSNTKAIPFSELEMIEGVIEDSGKNAIRIKAEKIFLDEAGLAEEAIFETLIFIPEDEIQVNAETMELKSEDDFRKEELAYTDWLRKAENDKDIHSFVFPPSWNKESIISLADLINGDSVRIVYYKSPESGKMVATKILKTIKAEKQEEVIDYNSKIIGFNAEVKEVGDGVFVVRSEGAVEGLFLKDDLLEIFVDDESSMYRKIIKKEIDYKKEEEIFLKERQKVKDEGGDLLLLKAPNRIDEVLIKLSDLKIGDRVETIVLVKDGKYLAQKVQQIIK